MVPGSLAFGAADPQSERQVEGLNCKYLAHDPGGQRSSHLDRPALQTRGAGRSDLVDSCNTFEKMSAVRGHLLMLIAAPVPAPQ